MGQPEGVGGRLDGAERPASHQGLVAGREGLELSGVTDDQESVEAGCDREQVVGAHLVHLVDDGGLPSPRRDEGPLPRRGDDAMTERVLCIAADVLRSR